MSQIILGNKVVPDTAKRRGDLRLSFGDGADRPLAQHRLIALEYDLVLQRAARIGNHLASEERHCLLSTGGYSRPDRALVAAAAKTASLKAAAP
jgi:hypothetical protein